MASPVETGCLEEDRELGVHLVPGFRDGRARRTRRLHSRLLDGQVPVTVDADPGGVDVVVGATGDAGNDPVGRGGGELAGRPGGDVAGPVALRRQAHLRSERRSAAVGGSPPARPFPSAVPRRGRPAPRPRRRRRATTNEGFSRAAVAARRRSERSDQPRPCPTPAVDEPPPLLDSTVANGAFAVHHRSRRTRTTAMGRRPTTYHDADGKEVMPGGCGQHFGICSRPARRWISWASVGGLLVLAAASSIWSVSTSPTSGRVHGRSSTSFSATEGSVARWRPRKPNRPPPRPPF